MRFKNEKESVSREMPILNEQEIIILRALHIKKYKYLVRDKSNKLYAYVEKPFKKNGCSVWCDTKASYNYLNVSRLKLFSFIQWIDKEPYVIDELLKGQIEV